jgi:ABC-type glycerol-3-phosphate transport system substrate-binding protein
MYETRQRFQGALSEPTVRSKAICRDRWVSVLALLMLAGALGCSDAEIVDECASMATGSIKLGSWWVGSEESDARESLDDAFVACNPQAEVNDTFFADKAQALARLKSMLGVMTAEAPAEVDVIVGNNDIIQFAGCAGAEESQLLPLTRGDGSGFGERPFREELLQALSCDEAANTVYGLPITTHRLNNLFYNERRLQAAGIDPDALSTWDGFTEALAQLSAARYANQLIFAIGEESWRLSLLAFENVMVSVEQGKAYSRFWTGRSADTGDTFRPPELEQTLDRLLELRPFVTSFGQAGALAGAFADSAGLNSVDAKAAVVSGEAVFTVTGDWWILGEPEAGVAVVPFPDTADMYVYTADVLAIPRYTTNPRAARAYLRAATSTEALVNFSNLKHAKPARTDLADLDGATAIPGLPSLVPHDSFNILGAELRAWFFADAPDDEALRDYIKGQYCRLPEARSCSPLPQVK